MSAISMEEVIANSRNRVKQYQQRINEAHIAIKQNPSAAALKQLHVEIQRWTGAVILFNVQVRMMTENDQ